MSAVESAIISPPATERMPSGAGGAGPKPKPLGQRLVDAGYIDDSQLDLALREKDRRGGFLGEVLVNLGFITPEQLTSSLAAETGTKVIDIGQITINPDALRLVSRETAKRFHLIPVDCDDQSVTVALADAFNVVAIDLIEHQTGLRVDVVTAPEPDILEAVERSYADERSLDEAIERLMHSENLEEEDASDASPMIRLVDELIGLGIKNRATDIHIEPQEKIVVVRTRIDGVLRQEVLIPNALAPGVTARLKLMAELDVTEKRVPQDGRIRFTYGRRLVDLRLSTLPTNFGESIVMRVLEGESNRPKFADLGFSARDEATIREAAARPHGMVLVTGPTGSGKTTTLYGSLAEIDVNERSVFTLEDPIEYAMSMVRQTQIKAEIGMTFAAGLRALLRQDPDVILVGEIRDTETAQLAVRAALTGHLVFSTLHTNSAVGVIPRLLDMGVESYLLPAALAAVVGQRLVRQICPSCREPVADAAAILERAKLTELVEGEPELFHGKGCDRCRHTGYRGRVAIYEVLTVQADMHNLIASGAPAAEIERVAHECGMRSMVADGLDKAMAGMTTVEEVLRVVR